MLPVSILKQNGFRRWSSPPKQGFFFLLIGFAILSSPWIALSSNTGQEVSEQSSAMTIATPAWALTVTDPTYPIRPGLTIIYTISYENIGDAPATHTVITDTIDAQTEYLLSTKAGVYDSSNHTVTWTLGTIEPGESDYIILRIRTRQGIPHGTEIFNRTWIDCDEGIYSNITTVTAISYQTILRVYKTTPVRVAYRGQEITYDISFSNEGDTSATDVLLTDIMHPQVAFVSCTGDCQFDSSEQNVFWEWAEISPGGLTTVQMTLRIDSTYNDDPIFTNEVTITCREGSSDDDSYIVTIDTTVSPVAPGAPAFALEVKSRDSYIMAGDEMLYRIEFENVGLDVAHALVLTDSIPKSTHYLNCTGGGVYDPSTETVTWNISTIERHQRRRFNLYLRAEDDLPDRSSIINRVSITCAEGFSISTAETTTVLAAPVLSFTPSSSTHEVVRGQSVTFTAALSNTGTASATNITVINPIPEHTSYASHTGAGSFDARQNSVTWHYESIPAMETATMSLTVHIAPDFPSDKSVTNRIHWYSGERTDSASISLQLMLPQHFKLLQNYPNPFNQGTTITFQLPEDSFVRVKIYNVLGQEVTMLLGEERQAGMHSISWDGRNAQHMFSPSGVYLLELSAEQMTHPRTKKMILLR